MKIEYVLIEVQNKDRSNANKERIITLLKSFFPELNSEHIPIKVGQEKLDLSYKITCSSTTNVDNTDFVYHILLFCEHDNQQKNADILETAHHTFFNSIAERHDYHLVIANDEVSEYYCNQAYPKFQRLERQLRHLIFKIVTKAHGTLWTKETISKELQKKLHDDIKNVSGRKRDDILIEAALHEMTMGQLISYLFYAPTEFSLPEYLDEYIPPAKLKQKTKEELIELIEQTRKKSIWNLFLSDDFSIDEPNKKLNILRENRNKVAHCKQFYSSDYSTTVEFLDLFLPKIESAIEKATIQDPPTVKSIVCGFSEFTARLASEYEQVNHNISLALQEVVEHLCAPAYQALQIDAIASGLSQYAELSSSVKSFYSEQIGPMESVQKLLNSCNNSIASLIIPENVEYATNYAQIYKQITPDEVERATHYAKLFEQINQKETTRTNPDAQLYKQNISEMCESLEQNHTCEIVRPSIDCTPEFIDGSSPHGTSKEGETQ